MITISLCMIVKDEEDAIKRCLESVFDVVDEIIIVDTGSNDNTKDIVSNYTKNIYDFEWVEDFSKARNFSFEKATKDYIFWLDADEFINEENKEKLINLKNNLDENIDIITMETHMCIDENNNPKIKARRNRIVKRNKNAKWVGFIHEYIEIDGEFYNSDIAIIHDKKKSVDNRNISIYKKNIELGNELNNRDLYYYGKELYCNCMFDEAIDTLEKFITKDVNEEEIVDALCKIGECYLNKGQAYKGREYFYKAFEFVEVRAEILYNIGHSFEVEKKYYQAINWYEIILMLPMPKDYNQCMNLACCRFKPHLGLCCCYFEIDDLPRAYYHHKKCKEINPLNKCVIANDEYFKAIIKEVKD